MSPQPAGPRTRAGSGSRPASAWLLGYCCGGLWSLCGPHCDGSRSSARRELITPVAKPARCSPPRKCACSIFTQRSMTTLRPASSPRRATSSCHDRAGASGRVPDRERVATHARQVNRGGGTRTRPAKGLLEAPTIATDRVRRGTARRAVALGPGMTCTNVVGVTVFWFTTSRTGVSRHPGMMSREIPDSAVLRAESAGHDIYPFADHRDGGREPSRP